MNKYNVPKSKLPQYEYELNHLKKVISVVDNGRNPEDLSMRILNYSIKEVELKIQKETERLKELNML